MQKEFGMHKRNIVILTASHPLKAAGIVAFDLMQNFKSSGNNVIIVTNAKLQKRHENIISLKGISYFPLVHRIINKVKVETRKLNKSNKISSNPDYHMYGLNQLNKKGLADKILKMLPFKADAFIYLFPQNFLNSDDLRYINKITNSTIFWYMMDMAPMTGGCHYAWDCLGFTKECGSCPGIYSNDKYDITHQIWKLKMENISQTNIVPVAATEWQFNQLKKSSLFRNKTQHKILLSINEEQFKPGNKVNARKKLGLPLDKKVIFFGSVSVNDKRKGFIELMEALNILKAEMVMEDRDNLLLIIAGHNNGPLEKELPFVHQFLGYLDFNNLATTFQAADFFVSPSIEDSGPMMINQSMMSGRPVVSFEMGVALDLVINYKTGYRAENKNSADLAKGIRFILSLTDNELEVFNNNCRKLALEKLSSKRSAQEWNKLLRTPH